MSVRWRVVGLALTVLILAACSDDAITRDDAVLALQTTGATEVEATCMADTLIALGELGAADPRNEMSALGRDAFRSARTRCIQVEVLSTGEADPVAMSGVEHGSEDDEFFDEEDRETAGASVTVDDDTDQIEDAAISTLVRFGYTPESAQCIVDHLVAAEGWSVLADPGLGLGLDSLEANAMAACVGVS